MNVFDNSLVWQKTGETYLGLGEVEVVVRVKREDERVDEFVVHRMRIQDAEDCSIATYESPLEIREVRNDLTVASDPPQGMVLTLAGQLLPKDDRGELYKFQRGGL